MATNFWKCEICNYIGPAKEFGKAGDRQCPSPKHTGDDREQVFPYRLYRCDLCAHEDGHDHFFGHETPIDDDPIELGWQATCGEINEYLKGKPRPYEEEDAIEAEEFAMDGKGCCEEVTVTQIK